MCSRRCVLLLKPAFRKVLKTVVVLPSDSTKHSESYGVPTSNKEGKVTCEIDGWFYAIWGLCCCHVFSSVGFPFEEFPSSLNYEL